MTKSNDPLKKDKAIYIGRLIRGKRKEKGWTQGELGELVGRKAGTISDIERGRGNLNFRTLSAIAKVLEIPISEIAEDEKKIPDNDDKYIDKTSLADLLKVREIVREQPAIYLGDKELSKESRIILNGMMDMIIERETKKQKKSPDSTED